MCLQVVNSLNMPTSLNLENGGVEKFSLKLGRRKISKNIFPNFLKIFFHNLQNSEFTKL